MTVSIAVTNSASISTWKNVPRIAKTPTTTMTSWSSDDERRHAELHVAEPVGDPEHDPERADDDEDERLADEVGADDRRRWSSGCACSSIGSELGLEGDGDLAELARRSGARCCRPAAGGRRRRPATRPRRRRGRARRRPDAPGWPTATGARCGLSARRGAAHALARPPTRRRRRAERRAPGSATGCAAPRPIGCSVLISMNPVPVEIAVASRPCSAKTASTWSGVTVGSSNLISQRVPPV